MWGRFIELLLQDLILFVLKTNLIVALMKVTIIIKAI